MDNSDITIDGFDPDALDGLSIGGHRQMPSDVDDSRLSEPDSRVPSESAAESVRGSRRGPDRDRRQRDSMAAAPASSTTGTSRKREAQPARQGNSSPAADAATIEPLDFSVGLGWVRDGRLSKMLGATIVILALFFFIVTISFFTTGSADQSTIMSINQEGLNQVDKSQIENAGGVAGALLSYNFMSRYFGIGAFAIIYWLTAMGFAMMRVHRFNLFSLTAKSLMSVIAISIVAGYISMHFVSTFHWGGSHGLYINELTHDFAGEIGCLLLSVLLLLLVTIVFMQDVTRGIRACVKGYQGIRASVMAENSRRKALENAGAAAVTSTSQGDPAAPAQANSVATSAPSPAPVSAQTPAPAQSAVKPSSLFDIDEEAEAQSKLQNKPIVVDPLAVQSVMPSPNSESVSSASHVDHTQLSDDFELEDDEKEDVSEVKARSASVSTASPSIPSSPLPQTGISVPAPAKEEVTPEQPSGSTGPAILEDLDVLDDIPVADEDELTTTDDTSEAAATPGLSEPEVVVKMAPEITPSHNIASRPYDPTAELSYYKFPSIDLLHQREAKSNTIDLAEQEENKQRLVATLGSFGIGVSHIEATIGPTVTLYEIVPSEGVRIARIKALENDLARAIAAIGTRIIAPIPGRDTVGIEVPNKDPQIVPIRSILSSEDFQNCHMNLPMAMGVTIDNKVFMADLCKMPHLLVAGATGMGKSVGLNTIIASLLYKKHPAELKFVLVDPKMVEFSLYRRLEKHYLAKLPDQEDAIITDPMQVIPTLNSLCLEMDQRYLLLKDAYVRNISEYNAKFIERRLNPEKGHRFLPYIVVVVDEFADLIMTAGKEVEQPIARIAQKARAVGIHLILATQRPSTNVITGIIKANFPGRIAFRVFQMVDSRTILDRPGANQLIGRGDMLFSRDGVIDRVQCAFIDTDEVDGICEAISRQQGYAGAYELPEVLPDGSAPGAGTGSVADMDPFFADAGRYVIGSGQGSTSAIQRHFNIGYPRAGKIMDQLEQAGVVGPVVGAKPRTVLMDLYSFESYLDNQN